MVLLTTFVTPHDIVSSCFSINSIISIRFQWRLDNFHGNYFTNYTKQYTNLYQSCIQWRHAFFFKFCLYPNIKLAKLGILNKKCTSAYIFQHSYLFVLIFTKFYYLRQVTEKAHEMDVELARWVEFGLNSSHSTSYAGNSQMVMVGCSLTKQLSAMHEKDLGLTFCVWLLIALNCLTNWTN